MAFLLAIGAIGAGTAYALNQYDKNQRDLAAITQRAKEENPDSGEYQQRASLLTPIPERPVLVPTTDLHGVPVLQVNTGDGAFAKFYPGAGGAVELPTENRIVY